MCGIVEVLCVQQVEVSIVSYYAHSMHPMIANRPLQSKNFLIALLLYT